MWVAIAKEDKTYLGTVASNDKKGVISSCLSSIASYGREGVGGCVIRDGRFSPICRPLCIRRLGVVGC